jgi:DNA invertase Pin-like site-specific DNA recombinase
VGSRDQKHDGRHRHHRPGAGARRDKPHLDLTSTIGKGLLAFLSAIAQDERERIAKRATEGRAAAKAQGRRFGRKPKLDEHQHAEALQRLAGGESLRAIARSYRVSHTTISRLAGA